MSKFRQDHDVFRKQLAELESSLEKGTGTWRSWRDTGFSLSRHLRAHVRDESGTIASCARQLAVTDAKTLKAFSIDHHQEWRLLRCANGYLARVIYVPDSYVRAMLARLVAAFRVSMDEQEAELFPLMNRVFGAQERFAETVPYYEYKPVGVGTRYEADYGVAS